MAKNARNIGIGTEARCRSPPLRVRHDFLGLALALHSPGSAYSRPAHRGDQARSKNRRKVQRACIRKEAALGISDGPRRRGGVAAIPWINRPSLGGWATGEMRRFRPSGRAAIEPPQSTEDRGRYRVPRPALKNRRSIWRSMPACSLQSRTRRAVARGPAALLDLRCARRPTGRQIGTAE